MLWRIAFVISTALAIATAAASPFPRQSAAAPPAVTVRARALQPGELALLTVRTGTPITAVTARAFDRDWPAYARDDGTWTVVVGIDLDVAPGAYQAALTVTSGGRQTTVREPLTVRPKQFRTRRLTVEPAYVNPPASVTARIVAEAQELSTLWTSSEHEPLWTGPFQRPVPQQANSAFGSRSVFNGQPRSPHGGADFPSPAGTPVHAPAAGRILLAKDLYYTGNSVVIDHGVGLVSLFAHLSRIDVSVGDRVEAGQVLGLVGKTGRVTGPHLHWTLRVNGARVDPLALLDVLGGA